MKKHYESKLAVLQLQLDEALQMLRLVAANKRTCLEVEEWLENNFPESIEQDNAINDLLNTGHKNDKS